MSWKYSGFKRFDSQPSNKHAKSSFDHFAGLVQSNDEEGIRQILKNKNIQTDDGHQLTVLHVAAHWADRDTMAALLSDRRVAALIEHPMYNGDTPLLTAARHRNLASVKLLLDHGADVRAREQAAGGTALHLAALAPHADLARMLLDRSALSGFVDTTDSFGDTALQVALREHSPTVQPLLQAGADYAKANSFTGRNVMHTAVAYNQCGIVTELMSSKDSQKLADVPDNRGDTSLMLAIRLACVDCTKSLITFLRPGKEINESTKESILHLAVETDNDEIVKHVVMFSRENVISHTDDEGRTALIYAIENHKDNCLEILFHSQSVYVKNSQTEDTVLHVAIRVDNMRALKILFQPNNIDALSWCFSQENDKGKTPLWLAVENGHAYFVTEARMANLVNVNELNRLGDSLFYVAAAKGDLTVLKALLLSDRYYNFCRLHQREAGAEKDSIVRNTVICCDIYNTDLFILTGNVKANHLNSWIPKAFLEPNQESGRNVYHACCIGSNTDCLDFVHSYFDLFDLDRSLFDRRDKKGNTPLLLATRNNPECVRYLLSNGADISNTNASGDSVLKSLLVNAEDPVGDLESVLGEGIIYDAAAIGLQEESECLRIDFTLFRPPNQPVTKVVKLFYESVHGPQRTELLQHTLFKVYVHLILISLNYFFMIRFIISCVSTLLLSFYIIFYSNPKEGPFQTIFFYGIRYILSSLSVLSILFSVPILYHHSVFIVRLKTYTLTLLPGALMICLTQLPYNSEFAFEIAALTVLVSWGSLLMYATALFKEVSNQIAMLTQVINGMMSYFRIVLIILLPFSLAFYCILPHDPFFITPGKSFFYTSFILLQGDTVDTVSSFEAKHFTQVRNSGNKNVSDSPNGSSQLESKIDLVFESAFLLVFVITCVLGLMNMLVGLAVRDGKTLAADGEVFRRNLQIHWLNSLEMFLNSIVYKVLKWTKLIFFFGIIPSKTKIDVEVRYSPMVDRKSYVFSSNSLIELKKSVVKSEQSHGKYSRTNKSTIVKAHSIRYEDRLSFNDDKIKRTTHFAKQD